MTIRYLRFFAALALLIGVLSSPAKAAFITSDNNWHDMRPVANWLCVDGNGNRVLQWGCHGGSNQKWRAEYWGMCGGEQVLSGLHSCFRFRNLYYYTCMDIPWSSSALGTRIELYGCHWGENQYWVIKETDGNDFYNSHRFHFVSGISRMRTQGWHRVLDVPSGTGNWGVQLQTWSWNRSVAQQFYFHGLGRY